MMQSLDLGSREEGKLWHRKPSPTTLQGVIINIIHSTTGYHSKTIRFLNVAFDSSGDSLLAGDHQGNIYVFELLGNRFKLVQRTAQACTALAFNLRRKTEFLVALADYSIKCFDTDSRELVSWMRGHDSSVSSISVHGSGRYAITSSADTAQLWDLDTFQRKRKLNIRQSVGIQKVFFLPLSNTIISCFKDNSVFAWEFDTLCCKYQLPSPIEGSALRYKVFAVTRDGRVLAAGGKSNHLHLWCLESKQLLRIIQMPTKVRAVRYLEFLPDSFDAGSNQVLGVLSQDNILRFINIRTCKLLFEVGSQEGISVVALSPNGRYVAAVMDNGSLNIYSIQALTQEINKPPPPLFRVIEESKSKFDTDKLTVRVASGISEKPWKSKAGKIQTKVLRPQPDLSHEDKENELPDGLNKKRLQTLLKGFGEYPAKYRMFVWRSLLHLPENHLAFSSLLDKGTHSAFVHLQNDYPIKSRKLLRVLQRTLSALAHWSTIFGELPYVPLLAFPFVKLFQNNQLICFEVVATVIVNWCQHWFEFFPNPPVNVLSMVENILAHHDKELLQHLMNYNITSQVYAWPLLETMFSEVLTREEWLKMFDNIFSNHPSYFLMVVAAYIICSRAPLLHCNQKEDFEYFFHHRNNMDINVVIKEAYHLMECTPTDIHPQRMLDDFVPLTKGQYPIFNKYPKFIVDYQSQERERIRQDEIEYLRERQLVHEVEAKAIERRVEDETWYRKQELLREAEEQRRKILLKEEEKLAEQRRRLAAVKRELKVKELQLLEAARRRFLKYQQDQREMELRRLDDEIARKASMRDQETAATVQDVEVRQMELESQRRLFQQKLLKEKETMTQEVRGELDTSRRKADLEEHLLQRLIETEQDGEQTSRQLVEECLAKVNQEHLDTDWRAQVLQKQRNDDMDRDRCYQEVAKLLRNNRATEAELLDAMKTEEAKKWEEVLEKREHLAAEEAVTAALDANRKRFLEREMNDALELAVKLQDKDGYFERLRDLRASQPRQSLELQQVSCKAQPQPGNTCLNDSSGVDSSAHFSLDRGRQELENREREMMAEVRQLRQKLMSQARAKQTPTVDAQWSS
ncbi:TBC1 domain family member 31 isoform X2 [Sceloporus undulatus]|uniref:TBC1 domain family member 31 isoform X2 n=1 Tax=Sceloporus undulatus TaxID=8520 RepID=UPI001C4C5C77|nr:TBC1 domain family member 31 isoform X2 [Sceloporus undulatus]